MARPDVLGMGPRQLNQLLIGPAPSHQAGLRGLAERQSKRDARHSRDQGLVEILDRLDEMSLTKNDLDRRRTRNMHLHRDQTDGHRLTPPV